MQLASVTLTICRKCGEKHQYQVQKLHTFSHKRGKQREIFKTFYNLSGHMRKVVASHAEGCRVDSRLRLH